MAGSDELSMNWSDGSEDELVRELLDDESPFFFVPKMSEFESSVSPETIANPLISNVYSGPTIEDIETALSSTYRSNIDPGDQRIATSRPPVSLFEKGFGKMENKYTLKIKSSGNAMADDGYKWRKYGQKSIKNSPYPRSYYRCTNPRCSAKKQVERSKEDPEMLIVTYEGLHLHFAYSHFLVSRPNTDLSSTLHASKRPRIASLAEHPVTELQAQAKLDEGPALMGSVSATERRISSVPPVGGLGRVAKANANNSMGTTTQGLLEDVVPMIVRNPSSQSLHSFDPSLLSCLPSPPLSSSSISITSSPTISHFDVGILAEM